MRFIILLLILISFFLLQGHTNERASLEPTANHSLKTELTSFCKNGEELVEFNSPSMGDGMQSKIFFTLSPTKEKTSVIKCVDLNSPRFNKEFYNEIDILPKLKSSLYSIVPNLIASKELIVGDQHYGILIETIAKGIPFSKFIESHPTEKEFLKAAYQLGLALGEFHKNNNTVHGDFHPGNLFYDVSTGKITLIDFGMAYTANSKDTYAEDVATLFFELDGYISGNISDKKAYHKECETAFFQGYETFCKRPSDSLLNFYKTSRIEFLVHHHTIYLKENLDNILSGHSTDADFSRYVDTLYQEREKQKLLETKVVS